jgi:hypothetical protein
MKPTDLSTLDVKLNALTLADLHDAIAALAGGLPDPDRIAFVQIDREDVSAVVGIARTAEAAAAVVERQKRTASLAAMLSPSRVLH